MILINYYIYSYTFLFLGEHSALRACVHFLTTEGKVHTRGSKYDTLFGVDGNLTVSSQVIQTALKQHESSQ